MYRKDDDEVIIALDAATGATRWQYAYHTPLVHNGYFDVWLNSSGPGPYSTPLIAGDTVFAVGVDGHFHALDKRTGEMLWAQDLVAAFDVVEYNAFASSPIAYGRTVILPLGGSGHGVVAFDRETGATVWRSPAFDLAPGSPVLIEVDGQDQLVVVGQQELVGLDPRDGRRLWSHPHANELGLNISMPVWDGDNALLALVRLRRRHPADPAVAGRRPDDVRGDLVQQPHAGALRQRPAHRRARARQHGRLRPRIRGRARRRDRRGGVAGTHLRPGADAGRRRLPRHPRTRTGSWPWHRSPWTDCRCTRAGRC